MWIFILLSTACTCNEDEEQADHVKVIISASGQPVTLTPFDPSKLMLGKCQTNSNTASFCVELFSLNNRSATLVPKDPIGATVSGGWAFWLCGCRARAFRHGQIKARLGFTWVLSSPFQHSSGWAETGKMGKVRPSENNFGKWVQN